MGTSAPAAGKTLATALAVVLCGTPVTAASGQQPAAPYDLLIRNGRIIDGTGSPWYRGDVAVQGGRIAAIGNLTRDSAAVVIDARGLIVAPGFIDMLGQSELSILVDPRVPSKVFQGITTEITGEGESIAPIDSAMIGASASVYRHYGITVDWHTLPEYFNRIQKQGMGINLGTYVGATSIREMVLGEGDVQPTADQLQQMQDLVGAAMRDGALGISTALEYPPAPYARTDELIALARIAAQHGGIYATHMRNEGDAELAALDETFRIAREARIAVEIFHFKTSGRVNFGSMPRLVARVDSARRAGLDISADTYAYTAWMNGLSAFVPPWAFDGGSARLLERLQDPAVRARIRREMLTPSATWDNEWQEIRGPHDVLVGVVLNPALRGLQGKRLDEIAAAWHEDAISAVFDLLVKDSARTDVAVFGMAEQDVAFALRQPWVSIGTDYAGSAPEGILGAERPHPRAYGTFPRILRKYVREEHLLTLPEAIRKFTALAAQREHLTDRGVIKRGMWADLVVFDPDSIADRATYDDPNQFSVGMWYVLVNGVPVIADGKLTGALPGRVLYGPGYEGGRR